MCACLCEFIYCVHAGVCRGLRRGFYLLELDSQALVILPNVGLGS